MKHLAVLTATALTAVCGAAHAHAHLLKSIPAAGETVARSPPLLALSFSEAARVTALAIRKGAEKPVKLGPLPAQSSDHVGIPLPPLAPGSYTVSWRVLSDDTHIMAGSIHFTVAPANGGEQPARP